MVGSGSDCGLDNVSLKQSKSGMVMNKPVWKVTLNNPCRCPLTNLKLSCTGFESVVPVDMLTKTADVCLLKNDILGDFVFKYVWDSSFELKVISGTFKFKIVDGAITGCTWSFLAELFGVNFSNWFSLFWAYENDDIYSNNFEILIYINFLIYLT